MNKYIPTLALLAAATGLSAQNLATFGGDYVTANTTLQGNDATGIANNVFSPTTVRSPAANYSGPVFYAGMGLIGAPGISGGNTNILQHVDGDRIQFGLSGGNTARTLVSLTMFNVSGWDSGNQQLTLTAKVIPTSGLDMLSNDVRLVVRSGSDYFVSNNGFSVPAAGELTNVTIDASSWLAYTPETSILGAFDTNVVNGLTAIDAVGIYIKVNTFDQATSYSLRTNIASLEVTAVPEPSTYAALAGLLALGFVAWRRRR
jgi:hypothetical protein